MPDTNEMLAPLCGNCGEFHQPREPCEVCGKVACSGDDYEHVYGCSNYPYCPQEPDE